MKENDLRILGLAITLAVHVGGFGVVWAAHTLVKPDPDKHKLKEYVAIEAGLARRKKVKKGRKSALPQKDVAPMVKPDSVSLTRDPSAADKSKKDDPKNVPPPDMVNPESVFDKFRQVETVGDPSEVGEGGADDVSEEGGAGGSEWGTLDDARGDPYVGELVGRMTTNPPMTVPSVVRQTGKLETLGCVRLKADGSVKEYFIPDDAKSKNRVFNRAVEERLKITTAMENPVPHHLKDLLITRGICVPYRY